MDNMVDMTILIWIDYEYYPLVGLKLGCWKIPQLPIFHSIPHFYRQFPIATCVLSECIEIYGDYGDQNCILDDYDHYHYYYFIFIISNEIMMISDNYDLISLIIIMIRYHNRHS